MIQRFCDRCGKAIPRASLEDPVCIVKKKYLSANQTEEWLDLCGNCAVSLEHLVRGFKRGCAMNWVNINDGLPEEKINPVTKDFQGVLCATTFGDARLYNYGTLYGCHEGHFWHGSGIMDKYVTHWMPLPSMPQDGDDQ